MRADDKLKNSETNYDILKTKFEEKIKEIENQKERIIELDDIITDLRSQK